jgi:hypothetical protein
VASASSTRKRTAIHLHPKRSIPLPLSGRTASAATPPAAITVPIIAGPPPNRITNNGSITNRFTDRLRAKCAANTSQKVRV